MATILEALQNARINLVDNKHNSMAFAIGTSQLDNAITLLEAGHPIDSDVEELLDV